MGMIFNSIGLVAVSEVGKYIDREIEVDNEGYAEIGASSSYFGRINTREELQKKVSAFPFLCNGYGKAISFSSMLRTEYRNHDLSDIDDFIQKNGFSAIIIYTYNEAERNVICRELSWLAYKVGSDRATCGTDWLPYDLQAREWITRPTKAEYISELIPDILDDSPAVRIEENRVFLHENSKAERLEKKLKECRSVQIQNREILLRFPDEDVLCADANGINTFVDISKAKQDFTRVWNHVIRTGGLYDYRDWGRKRRRYCDVHGGWDAAKNALTPEQTSGVPFQYANDPSECCALLDVNMFTFEDSLIKLAQKADEFVDYCRKVPLEAVRRKDGELKMGRYYPHHQCDFVLFPRISMSFSGCVVSADTIEMRACSELPEHPQENKIVTKEYYGDFEISSDKCLTGYSGDAQDLTLPDWIEKIDQNVFKAQENLETVRMPDGVKELGVGVFSYCKNIRDVKLSSGLEIIGYYAFCECESLKTIEIPDGVKELGNSAFSHCANLTSMKLPTGLEKIGRRAFEGCENLTSIVIPEGINELQASVFAGCRHLGSVHLPSTLEKIGANAFGGCSHLGHIEIPEGVKIIEDGEVLTGAFGNCKRLESVCLPSTLEKLGDYAFSGCISLTSVLLPPSLEKIRRAVFRGCKSLISIEIPEGVKKIESAGPKTGAFYECRNLKSVRLPSTLESIGEYAFCECESLASIEIPDTVTEIGKKTFQGCESLQIITSEGSYAAKFGEKNNIPVITEGMAPRRPGTAATESKLFAQKSKQAKNGKGI